MSNWIVRKLGTWSVKCLTEIIVESLSTCKLLLGVFTSFRLFKFRKLNSIIWLECHGYRFYGHSRKYSLTHATCRQQIVILDKPCIILLLFDTHIMSYLTLKSTVRQSEIITARKCNIIQTIIVSRNPYLSDKLYALRPNIGYETLDHKLVGLNCISLRLQERKRYIGYDHLKCMVAAAWSGCFQFMGRIGPSNQTGSVVWIWGVRVPGCNRINKCCCFIVKNILGTCLLSCERILISHFSIS